MNNNFLITLLIYLFIEIIIYLKYEYKINKLSKKLKGEQ